MKLAEGRGHDPQRLITVQTLSRRRLQSQQLYPPKWYGQPDLIPTLEANKVFCLTRPIRGVVILLNRASESGPLTGVASQAFAMSKWKQVRRLHPMLNVMSVMSYDIL